MLTLCLCNQAMFESPRRNHKSSIAMDLKCTFLDVIRGKPSDRSNRICRPKTLRVPVPVRSSLWTPFSKTSRRRSSYGLFCIALPKEQGHELEMFYPPPFIVPEKIKKWGHFSCTLCYNIVKRRYLSSTWQTKTHLSNQ